MSERESSFFAELKRRNVLRAAAFYATPMGLVDYWKHRRWSDLCWPNPERGPDSFTADETLR